MKAFAKIDNYISTRKSPQTCHSIANYFLLSKTTVNKVLVELEQMGVIKRHKIGRQYVYIGVRSN